MATRRTGAHPLTVWTARPNWHRHAACNGDGPDHWTIDRGVGFKKIPALRAVCARCPVTGRCLREALDEDLRTRQAGPLRVGYSGHIWASIAQLATDLELTTDDDHDTLAAWLLDGIIQLRKLDPRHWTPELHADDN